MAADQDYPDAVWLLGGLYSRGIGVIQDLDKADFLIHQASHLFRIRCPLLFSDSDRFWDCVRAYIDANITQ